MLPEAALFPTAVTSVPVLLSPALAPIAVRDDAELADPAKTPTAVLFELEPVTLLRAL